METGLRLDCETAQALALTIEAFDRQGLRAERSFELREALDTGAHACPCELHGTAECTCNYVVLSVYEPAGPAVGELVGRVVIHSSGSSAWLDIPPISNGSGANNAGPDSRLLRALADLVLACSREARVEAL